MQGFHVSNFDSVYQLKLDHDRNVKYYNVLLKTLGNRLFVTAKYIQDYNHLIDIDETDRVANVSKRDPKRSQAEQACGHSLMVLNL